MTNEDERIGITELGDPVWDLGWQNWLQAGRPTILITKDPERLRQLLGGLPTDRLIVHCTITGQGGSLYEPNVPEPDHALRGYHRFVDDFGPDRAVLRIDPVLPWVEPFKKAIEIATNERGRVRVSFLDVYPHVYQRFVEGWNCPPTYGMHAPSSVRMWCLSALTEVVGHEIEVCGEPDIKGQPCVSAKDCELLGVQPIIRHYRQRMYCGCLGNKVELLDKRKRCKFECLYCYWKD